MKKFNFDSTQDSNPKTLETAWFRLDGLTKFPWIIRQEEDTKNVEKFHIFGKDQNSIQDAAQIFLEFYPLPYSKLSFEKVLLDIYPESSFRIPSISSKKDVEMLLKPEFLESDHRCFLTKEKKNRFRICHVFTSDTFAILVVFSLNSKNFGNQEFFEYFHKNFALMPS